MQGNRKANYVGMAFMLVGALIMCIVTWQTAHPFSKYQPLSNAQAAYKECKAKAPPGFDCVMMPLLVSEESITELGAPQ